MAFIFPYIGNVIIPTDELHHFSEGYGRAQPPTRHNDIPVPSGLFNIAMENGPFIDCYLLKMVIFHGYVK